MADERIKIVVAEGAEDRGLLRFVLEGEGFDVVAEATTPADLVRAAGTEQPDVVVLSEAIGSGAIAMTRAASPSARIILVSPEEPADVDVDGWVATPQVVRGLGIAVLRACAGSGRSVTDSASDASVRPAWVGRVRKDPATLRAILATSTRGVEERPSITALQRRSAGSRRHPSMFGRREEPAAELDPLVLPELEFPAEPQAVQIEFEEIAIDPAPAPGAEVAEHPLRHAHPHKR
jgi:hypothetical protein